MFIGPRKPIRTRVAVVHVLPVSPVCCIPVTGSMRTRNQVTVSGMSIGDTPAADASRVRHRVVLAAVLRVLYEHLLRVAGRAGGLILLTDHQERAPLFQLSGAISLSTVTVAGEVIVILRPAATTPPRRRVSARPYRYLVRVRVRGRRCCLGFCLYVALDVRRCSGRVLARRCPKLDRSHCVDGWLPHA
jgi:hypothetical protein